MLVPAWTNLAATRAGIWTCISTSALPDSLHSCELVYLSALEGIRCFTVVLQLYSRREGESGGTEQKMMYSALNEISGHCPEIICIQVVE